jgi:hypothetical protein
VSQKSSECQETGTIAPAPENGRKKLRGVVDRVRKNLKKTQKNILSHFIHFQLQNNAPYALKLHLK